MSLGRAWLHNFDHKLRQAAAHGFEGIEIFYEDLEHLAKELASTSDDDTPTTPDQLLIRAAEHARQLCASLHLAIIGLQPFMHYEGLLDRAQHRQRIEKAKLWFRLAHAIGTQTIQIPANFLPEEQLVDDIAVVVADMREIADLGSQEQPPLRFAYENLCWGTHVDTWEKAWEVVRLVDRPNFGVCLDTFNIAGRVWADPGAPDGKTPNADQDLKESMERMVKEVDVEKVFYIQVVDAERMDSPLVEGHPFHVEGNPPRMNWSRNARAFIYEEDRGAYLPVEQVARTIIEGLGYKGFVSMELFSRTMAEEGEGVPAEHARRGAAAWKKLEQRLGLNKA